MKRRAALLMHPTSLPQGAAECLGGGIFKLLDWISASGFKGWQLLPYSPPDRSGSPYAPLSAFAGNPSWIGRGPIQALLPNHRWPQNMQRMLLESFLLRRQLPRSTMRSFERFREHPVQDAWLLEWAMFRVLKRLHRQAHWVRWPKECKSPSRSLVHRLMQTEKQSIELEIWKQFLFDAQWQAVKRYARQKQIALIGDCPIHVAWDSADAWGERPLFQLMADGFPRCWGGVPPDAFSKHGQLWKQPTHRWFMHHRQQYRWWIQRLSLLCHRFDRVRLDHFRGFEAFWEVPATATTALRGRWRKGPGRSLFDKVFKSLNPQQFWAEDLGLITAEVDRLREAYRLPSMHVLQFGFDESPSRHDPKRIPKRAVAYTGTHDNNTTKGWYLSLPKNQKRRVAVTLGVSKASAVCAQLNQACLESKAHWAVLPMQDLLGLGEEARMNRPGHASGQWQWRLNRFPPSQKQKALRRQIDHSGR